MNVLLAEANVPYDQLKEMDEINPEFPQTDVALVVGANDVVEPRRAQRSGEPDLRDADPRRRQGASVVVLKRSLATGFAGIDNPLFYDPKTVMLFGDAKTALERSSAPTSKRCSVPAVPFFSAPRSRRRCRRSGPRRGAGRVRRVRARRVDDAAEGLRAGYPAGDFRAMPALGGGHALLKWVTSFPGNPRAGLPTVMGLVVLSDASTRCAGACSTRPR